MSKTAKTFLLGLSALGLLVADISPQAPLWFGLVPEAGAWIGRPLTPVSYAGVARRTTRRVVAADTAALTATAAVATTAAAGTAGAAAGYAAAGAGGGGGSVPVGTVVQSLPSSCVPIAIKGVEYYNCGPGVYYRAAFQGANLVYVSSQP